MAYVADELVIYACTQITKTGEPNVISPFIKYLEEGKEFTPRLREWLVELLKNEGSNEHSLEYKQRRGRRTSLEEFERDTLIFERANELENKTVTLELCQQFSARTLMSQAEADPDRSIYRFGWKKRTEEWGFPTVYVDVSLTLKIGEQLNADQIHKILADEFDSSLSTITRTLRSRRALSNPEE
jgi:hypothetical protein